MLKRLTARSDVNTICFLLLCVGILFLPILFRSIIFAATDYPSHMNIAEKMWETGRPTLPHFLYHVVVLSVEKPLQFFASNFSIIKPSHLVLLSQLIAAMLFYEALAIVLYFLILRRQALTALQASKKGWYLIGLVLSLMIVMPIPLFMWIDGHAYMGYIGINIYHNPTIVALKPFAILSFCYAAAIFDGAQKTTLTTVLKAAAVTMLSALAKPSYLICLLPALVTYTAYQYVRGIKPNTRLLFVGILLPSLIILTTQYAITYRGAQGGILFAPFQVMGLYSNYLGVKFLFSIAFPLATYLCYFEKARRVGSLNLSWLVFFFGAAFTYLLAEQERFSAGNFAWSGQICLLLLFIESTLFLLAQIRLLPSNFLLYSTHFIRRNPQLIICLTVFALHVLSGLNYYFHALFVTSPHFYW